MVFSSVIFLFGFLPIILVIYSLTPEKHKNLTLLLSSLAFYFWGENLLVLMLLASTLANYFFALLIGRQDKLSPTTSGPTKKLILGLSVAVNIGLLCWYKYSNFFVQDILLDAAGLQNGLTQEWTTVILPLGISFYTFQSMSYVIDVYRGTVPATRNYIDFACYVTSFPQLVAGPIVRYKDIAKQLVKRTVTLDDFHEGVNRFIVGLAKKVLIANTVARSADAIYALPAQQLDAPLAWLGAACYTLQIYFDFSGYSDMAIGLGKMFGFTFPENFNYPYISKSIQEFWRRWHISLSTWFRDYLYIPLGGNRVAPWRTYANLWIVFVLCGLWHGASWNFIIWGIFHGFFLVLERGPWGKMLAVFPAVFRHAYTLFAVMIGWTIFRADNMTVAREMLGAMFGFGKGQPATLTFSYYAGPDVLAALAVGILFSIPLWKKTLEKIGGTTVGVLIHNVTLVTLFILSITAVSSSTYNPFLYFRF